MIYIFTDGSARGNPGPGGYGAILVSGPHRKELSQGFRMTTNNRMELLSVVVALETLKKIGEEVVVYSDSKYVVDAVEKGWLMNWVKTDFKGKKNADIWKRFLKVYQLHRVKFRWIKGHNNHPENERCDQMAVASSSTGNLMVDSGFESGLYN